MSEATFLKKLLSLPIVEYAKIAPNGRWVAFTWYRRHANLDVFVAPCDGSAPPVAFTNTPEATELVGWAFDSNAIIVSEDHGGDERRRLFLVDFKIDPEGKPVPGEMQPLTEDSPPYFIRGGILSPDGTTLYYGANFDFEKNRVTEPTLIYRHERDRGERSVIARPQRPAYITLELNRPGTHLIYTCKDRHPSGRQVHLVDLSSLEDREILWFGDQVKVIARWLPDGEHMLVLSESTGSEEQDAPKANCLGVYHWPSSRLRWLITDPNRSIEGAWASLDGAMIVDEIIRAVHHPFYIEPPDGGWTAVPEKPIQEIHFPMIPGNLFPLGRLEDGSWVARHHSSTTPTELIRFKFDPQAPAEQTPLVQSLTRVWELTSLQPSALVQAENFEWESIDGLRIQGWLYRAKPNLKRAVIYIHGGPSYHSEDELNAEIQYLVRRGFNVLDVNYRGSTGFGFSFREAIKADGWGGAEQEDIACASDALIREGLADAGRVGVTGTSYGGYSAWCQITRQPADRIGAAAPICGMTDLIVDYETTRPDLRPLSEEMMGGSPQQIPERYYKRSPIHFVNQIRGKLLIIQGARDPNVTPENVHQVTRKLEEHGIDHEILVFDDEGHGIHKPQNQEILYTRLADFFERALG